MVAGGEELHLQVVSRTQSGVYTCNANNGVEPNATKEIKLGEAFSLEAINLFMYFFIPRKP